MSAALDRADARSIAIGCPVCGGASDRADEAPGWGEWRSCPSCTLEFAHPLRLPESATELYRRAYHGQVEASGMAEYQRRLQMRRTILSELRDPKLWFWTPAFHDVLAWLRRRVRPGGTVLELGCGLGFMLHAMRDAEFQPVGLDVAETPVELNRRDGFKVWHGPLDTLPRGWVRPDALVSFFVLHHLEDPVGFLRMAREHAPRAPLAIVVHGYSDYRRRNDAASATPPRTLTKWSAPALVAALEAAGYRPAIHPVASTGAERRLLKLARRLAGPVVALPPVYRLGKRLETRLLARLPRQARNDGYVIVAFADPA